MLSLNTEKIIEYAAKQNSVNHTNTTDTTAKQTHPNLPIPGNQISSNVLKQKVRPIRMHKNIGKMASPGPAWDHIEVHKQFSQQTGLRAIKKRPKVIYMDFYEEYENPG